MKTYNWKCPKCNKEGFENITIITHNACNYEAVCLGCGYRSNADDFTRDMRSLPDERQAGLK